MRRVLALAAAFALALPSTAVAKGPISATACGASGCSSASIRPTAQDHLVIPPYAMRGSPDSRPRQAAPWFNVRFRIPDNRWRVDDRCQTPRPRFPFCYPKRRVFALADGSYAGGSDLPGRRIVWQRLTPKEANVYAQLTRGLEPMPAQTLPGTGDAQGAAAGQAIWPWVAVGGVVLAALGGSLLILRRSRRSGVGVAGLH